MCHFTEYGAPAHYSSTGLVQCSKCKIIDVIEKKKQDRNP